MLSQKANGCIHPERPAKGHCLMCGKGTCTECLIREIIDQRVISQISAHSFYTDGAIVTSSGSESVIEYGIYCPRCYLDQINKPGYKIMVKPTTSGPAHPMDVKKPIYFGRNGLPIGSYILYWVLFIIPIFTFIVLFMFYWEYERAKESYNDYIDHKSKAESIVKQMQKEPKREPEIKQSQKDKQIQIEPKREPVIQQSKIAQTLQNLQTEKIRYCGKCGTKNKSSQKFCSECGTKTE
ncbi:MAG: zinc-ribbon domain-containing protein [Candidatus Heimdallarchaeota archaeon]